MRWNHLPVAGGVYDQHPQLIDQWLYIFDKKNERDKAEAEKQKTMAARKAGSKPRVR